MATYFFPSFFRSLFFFSFFFFRLFPSSKIHYFDFFLFWKKISK